MATPGLTDTTIARRVPLIADPRLPLAIVLMSGLGASVLPLSSDGPVFLLAVTAALLTSWLVWRFIRGGQGSAEGLGRTARALGATAIVLAVLALALGVVRWTWGSYYAPPPMSIGIGMPGSSEAVDLRIHHRTIMTNLTLAQWALAGAGLTLCVWVIAGFRPRPR